MAAAPRPQQPPPQAGGNMNLQSGGGCVGAGGGGGGGQQPQPQGPAAPAGQEAAGPAELSRPQHYTIPGILHYIQHEWARFEMERAHWEVERAELQVRGARAIWDWPGWLGGPGRARSAGAALPGRAGSAGPPRPSRSPCPGAGTWARSGGRSGGTGGGPSRAPSPGQPFWFVAWRPPGSGAAPAPQAARSEPRCGARSAAGEGRVCAAAARGCDPPPPPHPPR